MTIRQQFLKTVYPAYVKLSRVSKNKSRVLVNKKTGAPVSFYSLQSALLNEQSFDFSLLRGRKVLLVNTASGCGFTEQFDQMQKLYRLHNHQLIVLAFPTNDFGEEKATDEEIALFCRENFRVSFPIMKKTVVKNTRYQNPVFNWLIDPAKNGWNSQPPTWNFCKYLVNEKGMLTGYFGSAIEPIGREIADALENC